MLIPNICEGHGCAEVIEEVNVESWEVSGKFLCADCAEADFERRANDDGSFPATAQLDQNGDKP